MMEFFDSDNEADDKSGPYLTLGPGIGTVRDIVVENADDESKRIVPVQPQADDKEDNNKEDNDIRVNPMINDRKRRTFILITLGKVEEFGDLDIKADRTWCSAQIEVKLKIDKIIKKVFVKFDFKWYIIAREKHGDESNHWHIAMELKKGIRRCDMYPLCWSAFPWYRGYLNVSSEWKSDKRLASYLLCPDKDKEIDPKPVIEGVDEKVIARWKRAVQDMKKWLCCAEIVSKCNAWNNTWKELKLWDEGFGAQYMSRIKVYWSECMLQKFDKLEDKDELKRRLDAAVLVKKGVVLVVVMWLLSNLFQERHHRQLQLYMWGGKHVGKTSIMSELQKYFMACKMPYDNGYFDLYNDDLHEFIYLDEYRGQISVHEMNNWLDGSRHSYARKGSQAVKRKNIPMIVLSNIDLNSQYPKICADEKEVRDAFISRFVSVEVDQDDCNLLREIVSGVVVPVVDDYDKAVQYRKSRCTVNGVDMMYLIKDGVVVVQ